MILGLHHTAISTSDIDRLVAFYRDVFGFQLVGELRWAAGSTLPDTIMGLKDSAGRQAMLRAGNCFLEVFEFAAPAPAERSRAVTGVGFTHICMAVRDLAGEYERLQRAGVRFNSAPQSRPTHSAVYGHDPDGNVFELIEVFEPSHPYSLTNVALEPELPKSRAERSL